MKIAKQTSIFSELLCKTFSYITASMRANLKSMRLNNKPDFPCLHTMTAMNLTLSQIFMILSQLWKPMAILLLTMFVTVIYLTRRKSKAPIHWPILGMFPTFLLALKTGLLDIATNLLQDNNDTITIKGPWLCNFDLVVTADPRNLEYVLKTNVSNFRKGHTTVTVTKDFLGENMFNMDGENWLRLRKVTSIKLHSPEFNNLVVNTWAQLVQSRLMSVLDKFSKQSVEFDLQDLFSRLSFDQSCITIFGVDVHYLAHNLPMTKIARAFKHAEDATALRFFYPKFIWKLMKYCNLGWERELKTSVDEMNKFANKVITSRKMEFSENCNAKKSRLDLLSMSLDSNSDTDLFLRDYCFNLMFAAADTIPVALSWFFWLLDQNPDVEEKIHTEICSIVRKQDTGEENIGAVSRPEEVKKMQYLHAALTESLRLYPSVPLEQREVKNKDQLPNGEKLKKGVRVILSMFSMGRMESIWGKDCREFKPERWLKDGKFVPESPYKFTAFIAGVRSCLGKDIAYYQMKVVVAFVIYRYRIKVVKNHPVEPTLSMMLLMKHGLKVTVSRRDENEHQQTQTPASSATSGTGDIPNKFTGR